MLRLLRGVGTAIVAVPLLAVLVAGMALVVVARASFPKYDGEIRLPGLTADVDVERDADGVPHVWADTAEDLLRAQGYLHAQDRFWEMDFRRHVTAGRLSEMFGQDTVETDAYVRTLGWRRVAEQEFALLSVDVRRWLQVYSEGVNAYLKGRKAREVSLEYAVLDRVNGDYKIEPWGPVDSLAWLKAMAWDLRGNMQDELTRSRLLAAGLDVGRLRQLYPPYPLDRHSPIVAEPDGVGPLPGSPAAPPNAPVPPAQPPTQPSTQPSPSPPAVSPSPGGAGGGEPVAPAAAVPRQLSAPPAEVAPALRTTDGKAALTGASTAVDRLNDTLSGLLGTDGSGIGSNSWVLAGVRSKTGRPILANDPHLGPVMPSIWYPVALHCTTVGPRCPFEVQGFSFSGVPGVVIGHNGRVAWGFTNLGPDVTDLYLEKVDGDTYEFAGRKLPLVTRKEKIKVAGEKPVEITVRSTGHGPLLSDQDTDLRKLGRKTPPLPDAPPGRYAVALRWTALEPGRTAEALYGFNVARDWTSFRSAARLFSVPSQNIVYADVDGHIGYQAPGDIPIRGRGDGMWPAPGWDPRYEWVRRIPFDELPSRLDPPSGAVVTANQAVTGVNYRYLLTTDWEYGYRSQRIADMIANAGEPLSVDDVQKMQFDAYSDNAAAIAPVLLRVTTWGRTRQAQKLMEGWDYQMQADSAPAAFFNATWRALLERMFDDELPSDLGAEGGERWFEAVRLLVFRPNDPWWDDRDTGVTESMSDTMREAMDAAADELSDKLGSDPKSWRWGDLHTLTLENATFGKSDVAPIRWLFNRGPYRAGGGSGLVQANGWYAPDGYEVDWVPSMRMVVDLGDFDRSRWIHLTGTSGHAFHEHYADQTERWRTGKTSPMRWSRPEVERAARHQLTFRP